MLVYCSLERSEDFPLISAMSTFQIKKMYYNSQLLHLSVVELFVAVHLIPLLLCYLVFDSSSDAIFCVYIIVIYLILWCYLFPQNCVFNIPVGKYRNSRYLDEDNILLMLFCQLHNKTYLAQYNTVFYPLEIWICIEHEL